MANEKRLIDVAPFMKTGWHLVRTGKSNEHLVSLSLADVPTVDAVEVVHGYNLDEDTPSLFECSICHWSCGDTYYGDTADYNYCPMCGAKLEGGLNDE